MTEKARQDALQAHLLALAAQHGGSIAFDVWMHHVLYAPNLGYYTSSHPVGSRNEGGDFITAPQLGPLFAYAMARSIEPVFHSGVAPVVLECGAGTGQLAHDILQYYAQKGQPLQQYYILEVSASLRAQQQETLKEYPCVQWLTQLPTAFEGVILGNELLDAIPVKAYEVAPYSLAVTERTVMWNPQIQAWAWGQQTVDVATAARVLQRLPAETIQHLRSFGAAPYQLEIGEQHSAWVTSMAAALKRGLILLIDYGFPRAELYHPQRISGTLMAHYKHRATPDILQNVGLADITAHVDFTAIAQAGQAQGLMLMGYTHQARFLINAGIGDLYLEAAAGKGTIETAQQARNLQLLMSEAEMGELFKVIALGRDCAPPLGFDGGDRSHRLMGSEPSHAV